MCGIAGFIDLRAPLTRDGLERDVIRMTDSLVHRGPDDSGCWVDPERGVALGHRRLAILDVSQEGHQPMASASGRFQVVYNGEIYNFGELKAELAGRGHAFRSSSDTEVLLACFEQWGIERSLPRILGMFAFAVWDRQEGVLTLARDRAGEKPLYYADDPRCLLFGSELKALRAHRAFDRELDPRALYLYLELGYVPAPRAIHARAKKLPPASFVQVRRGDRLTCTEPRFYWDAAQAAREGVARRGSEHEESVAIDRLDALLRRVVSRQMISDVPLGSFLSGGIDSSLVTAIMKEVSTKPVRTFSIGFEDPAYDESAHARAVARHLGTEHTELRLSAQDAMGVIPSLPEIYDEPFADSSQIPTHLVSRMARKHVTVALSGDGGDEVFGGYNRYLWVESVWGGLRLLPAGVRRGAARALTSVSPEGWSRAYGFIPQRLLPDRLRLRLAGDKVHKVAGILDCANAQQLYLKLISTWKDAGALLAAPPSDRDPWPLPFDGQPSGGSIADQIMLYDFKTYLPGDILAKVDRASMAVSLETRAPFLDPELIELAWGLPAGLKMRQGKGKWILRRLLDRYVPRELIERPKMGFGLPIGEWLRGPLRGWAEALLDEKRLREQGLLVPALIRQAWDDHLSRKRNAQHELWVILSFQAWLERQRSP